MARDPSKSFAGIVSGFIDRFSAYGARALADEFEATVGTVARWAEGTSEPRPAIKKAVRKWITYQSADIALVQALAATGLGSLGTPSIGYGPYDGQVSMTWETGDHYINVEMSQDGTVECFYENIRTRELWEHETTTSLLEFGPLSAKLQQVLGTAPKEPAT